MKIVTILLTAFFLAHCTTTFAQPGSLDSDFDGDGKVTTAFGTSDDYGRSAAVQPDGKIIVAGSVGNNAATDFALARYNSDGTLDNNFSGDGKVTTDFGFDLDQGRSVALQPDGKIVVAGFTRVGTEYYFALTRYNTDGILDNSFDVDGKVTTDFATGSDYGFSVAIQPDGKIVVAGESRNGNVVYFALARYNADGILDNSFGVDGKVTTDFGMGQVYVASVAIQPDGRILVVGSEGTGFALARYNTDGTLDNSFSVDGKVTTIFGTGPDFGNSVAIRPNGKIIVAGVSWNGTDFDFAVARYNPDGTLDNSFSADGKVTTAFGTGDDQGWSVAIQPDEKIIVSGQASNGSSKDFAIARYNTDGTLDNSFGLDGKVTTALGTGDDVGRSVAIQPDGRIVVAGFAINGTDQDFAVARYISGLDIGIIEFSLTNTAPLIYPNPIVNHATLKYTLQNAETISIELLDMQGKTIQTFIEGQQQAAGAHQQAIDLPEALPAGSYLIAISSPKGRFTVQVVK